MTKAKTKSTTRPVIVCTEFRGVFFGYADDTSGDPIHLKNARCAVYWDATRRGILGLASDGPGDRCRIGKPADIELRKITAVIEVSPTAVKAWENAPWA